MNNRLNYTGYVNGYIGWIIFAVTALAVIVVLGILLYLKNSGMRQQKKDNQELWERLRRDELTGLYNRTSFLERARKMLDSTEDILYIVHLNVRNFKLVNDIYGAEQGDKLLFEIGQILRALSESKDFIAGRFSADRFLICIRKSDFEEMDLPGRMQASLLGKDVLFTYGIYPVDDNRNIPVSSMCDRAQMAQKSIDQTGENIAYYSDEERQKLLKEQVIEKEMDKALEEGQFCIYIQPKYHVETEKIMGGEALVRWIHPEKGMIPPIEFIELFERNGFIRKLDYFVWEQSCRFVAQARKQGLPRVPLSVNVSRNHFLGDELIDKLVEMIKKYDLAPWELELEITETLYGENLELIFDKCRQLRKLGFKLIMDDFGSGYSSLNMLKETPVDIIKMDIHFLSGEEEQAGRGRSILRTLIELAHDLGLGVIVEGLETKDQKIFLKNMGNCVAQGYYYSRPVPVTEYIRMLQSETPGEQKESGTENPSAQNMENGDSFKGNEINALLPVLHKVFPELLLLNLTKGTYSILQYDKATTLGTPRGGRIDDMLNIRLGGVVEEDRERFEKTFSIKNLQETLIEKDAESIHLVYRRPGQEGRIYWFETTIVRYLDPFESDLQFVAMSRHVDDRIEEEVRLREQMWMQSEELRIILSQMGNIISYYDVASSTFTMPSAKAMENNVPNEMENFPESFIEAYGNRLLPEAARTIQDFYDGIRSGKPSGSCEYLIKSMEDEEVWTQLEYVSIFDSNGKPVRAVVTAKNVTRERARAAENRRLKKNEQILKLIAQHSDRIVSHYDVQKDAASVWDEEGLRNGQLPYLCKLQEELENSDMELIDESREVLDNMFSEIRDGERNGYCRICTKKNDNTIQWFDIQYSTIFDEDGKPISALISHKDITREYEYEMTYLRQEQSFAEAKEYIGILEVDLTTDTIERQGGKMAPPGISSVGRTLTDFAEQMVTIKMLEKDRAEGLHILSSAYLLKMYEDGNRYLSRTWQMMFRSGKLGWVRFDIELLEDPYTKHIKGFFRMWDVTAKQEKQIEIQHRSEYDGMTGLLNRFTAEERIRSLMAKNEVPGILILLDMDELKKINDTYGHAEGDRAIIGISENIKKHFRETDIIGRAGGDEFIIYLPGAAENKDAISISLMTLLRKLSSTSLGTDDRRLRCSIGCAVEGAGSSDSYEELFRRADTALYHIKRNGKNNFAFYSPEMEKENYSYKEQSLFAMKNEKKFKTKEMQNLLDAIADFYQLVLSVNVTGNDYFLMEEIKDGVFSRVPAFGILDDFVRLTAERIHPEDVEMFENNCSREALLNAHKQGMKNICCNFRFLDKEEYRPVETIVIFYMNEKDDLCDYTFVRWADPVL